MSKPFDVTMKHLLEGYPSGWLAYLGLKAKRVKAIDADLATVSAEADKVLRVEEPSPRIIHLEFQVSHDRFLARRLLRYNVLLNSRHGLPVRSVVVLLRPDADGPELTGVDRHHDPDGLYLEFHYRVMRVWTQPAHAVLAGGLGILPLAPLSDAPRNDLPDVIRHMDRRIRKEAGREEAATLWTATYVLLGLRYEDDFIAQLLQGVRNMKESVTYQAILAEGRAEGRAEGVNAGKAEEARKLLLHLGAKRLGAPNAGVIRAIQEIQDLARLEKLTDRLLDVKSWPELLAPSGRRRNGSRKKPI